MENQEQKTWTHTLKQQGFHQLLSFHKDEKENISGSKIKGWWRRGDIKGTKQKATLECWVKSESPVDVPCDAHNIIKSALAASRQNFGKDSYIIDREGPERSYWLGTESELLGVFHFDGTFTSGDGSCDVTSHTMGADFCKLSSLG